MEQEMKTSINKFTDKLNKEIKHDLDKFLSEQKETKLDKINQCLYSYIIDYYSSTLSYYKESKENGFSVDAAILEGKLMAIRFFDDLLCNTIPEYESIIKIYQLQKLEREK